MTTTVQAGSFKASLRRAVPVLVAYSVFSVWGVGCFVMSLALTAGGFGVSAGAFGTVAAIIAATALGQVAGNLLGLARLRLAIVLTAFLTAIVTASLSGLVLGPFALFGLVFVIAAIGGYLGVASRLDVVASWFPLSFAVGGAIVWMNAHGAIDTFHKGAKHAVWDVFTITCLAGAVFLNLVFLATRNALGLTVWQDIGRAAGTQRSEGANIARPGRGSLLVLLVFSMAVLGATAIVSPYLFRTAEQQGETQPRSDNPRRTPEQGDGNGKPRQGPREQGEGPNKPMGEPDGNAAGQASSEALAMGMRLLAWLIGIAIVLFILGAVIFAPLRRWFLLRHLERPIWPVSPTTRVINLWRRALAALAVLEIVPSAGEAPRAFARRAAPGLATVEGDDGGALTAAAEIVERVDYEGRGLGADDERTMRAAVQWLVGRVRVRVGLKRRLAAAWGPAPEIER